MTRLYMRTFDVTPDGKKILFGRLRDNSAVVMIEAADTCLALTPASA